MRLTPETYEEMIDIMKHEYVRVNCRSIPERRIILCLLGDRGFALNDAALSHVTCNPEDDHDFEYPYPGFDSLRGKISDWRVLGDNWIEFEDAVNLLEPEIEYVPDDKEFNDGMLELLGY